MNILVILSVVAVVMTVTLSSFPANADDDNRKVTVTGGGEGTFFADLDGDTDIDGSYFGMGIVLRDNAAEGHFVCAMWGNTNILGLSLMGVEGQVTIGRATGKKSATFSGVGTVDLGNGQFFTDVPFDVTVTKGGSGIGTLQLTVIGVFDGVAGDTIIGNDNYDLPVETVSSGLISIR